jgi:DNA-binding CsgD family transcriptional regulator
MRVSDPAVVRDVLGVTLGEARVASLLATGLSPGQVAEQLGISKETTRTVLKRIYGKVGVSRQNELTALLTKTVLSLPKT